MNNFLELLSTQAERIWKQAKVQKGLFSILAAVLIFQIYFVRELLAAELLLAIAFLVVMTIAGICYAFGIIGELSIAATEIGLRAAGESTKRGISALEQFSRDSIRHFPCETAK
jgi:hypothetical protein